MIIMNKWINNNNISKVLALAVSILLWSMVHLNDVTPTPTAKIDSRIIDNVKVQAFGLDEKKYILSAMDTDQVQLEVKGKKSDLLSMYSEDYKVRLDLSKAKVGTSTLPLTVDVPSGIEVVNVQPSTVTVNIEKRDTSSFPVSIVTSGEPAAGYQMGSITMEPATVSVTLPESDLKRVDKIQGSVSIDGEDATIKEKRVKLTALDKQGKEIEGAVIEPSTISVVVPITPPYKEVPIELHYSGQLPDGIVISKAQPSVTTVKLYGSQDALAGIKSYNDVDVDLGQIKEAGTMVLPVDLTPPQGFEKIEPSSMEVEITTVSNSQRVIDDIPIKISGAGSDVQAAIKSPASGTMSLKLSGAPGLLNSLTKDDIQLIASVGNLKPGTHQVNLQVVLPRYVSRVDQGNALTATIEIKDNAAATSTQPDSKPEDNSKGTTDNGNKGAGGNSGSETDSTNVDETDNNGTAGDTPPPEGQEPQTDTGSP